MDLPVVGLIAVIAGIVGAAIGFLIGKQASAKAEALSDSLRLQRDGLVEERDSAQQRLAEANASLADERANLAAEKAAAEEKKVGYNRQITQLTELNDEILNRFKLATGKSLDEAQEKFVERAGEIFTAARTANEEKLQQLIDPMKQTLDKYQADLRELEKTRKGAFESITTQMSALSEGQEKVANEALRLRTALRAGTANVGRWGEEQCRNVLEGAGLQEGIDFQTQSQTDSVEDRSRPDFVVSIPGGRKLVIDVKCSLDAFIGASQTDDLQKRDQLLLDHARAIKSHAQGLMKREYQEKFKGSANFVVMFVPGENFLHAAVEKQRDLLHFGRKNNVLIAGPTNLVSIAMTVAMLRDQEKLHERAEQIREIGVGLYKNLATLGNNAGLFAASLRTLLNKWDTLAGTIDGNLLSSARKFDALGVGQKSPNVHKDLTIEKDVKQPTKLLDNAPGAQVMNEKN